MRVSPFLQRRFLSKGETLKLVSKRSYASPASNNNKYDPLARRPNKICDPYGQGGKPLSRQEAQNLLATVDGCWKLVPEEATEIDDPPTALVREFFHQDFLQGAQFVTKIAAVGHVSNHYPSIMLERRLLPKAWQVVSRVECRTPTLQGLSYNDFHVAMQIDVEVTRPEVEPLLLSDQESQRKIT